jgi:hypothetical protein
MPERHALYAVQQIIVQVRSNTNAIVILAIVSAADDIENVSANGLMPASAIGIRL